MDLPRPGEQSALPDEQPSRDNPPNKTHNAASREPSPNQSVVLCDVQLSKNDARNWSKKDAFRHFYVNWREGMREVSKLPTKPMVEYTETDAFITIRAPRTGCPVAVQNARSWGFIRFIKEKGTLVLNIADGLMLRGYLNQASAQRSGSGQDQGSSDKRAPTPSNGLLKAAMVMMLSGYQVRFESSKDRWDFFFTEKSFSFSRTPSTEEAFLASFNQPSFTSSPAENVAANDLTIAIGPGDMLNRKVDREKFFQWLGGTLDITNFLQPSSVIQTEHGDLLLDPNFANTIYVNGILLSTSHVGPFTYGYHFHNEGIADGLVLMAGENEAQLRCRVWEAAIEKDIAVLGLLVGLLRYNPRASDVSRVEVYMQPGTVVKIWEFLVVEVGRQKLYCQETDDLAQIRQLTERQVVVIPPLLWSILRRPYLIRTWSEELLFTAPPAMPPENLFSAIVHRTFKALLKLDPYTAKAAVIFVEYPLTPPSVYCDNRVLLFTVSRYWLDFDVVHTIHRCRRSAATDQLLTNFPCDHVIISLYEHAIEVVSRTLPATPDVRAAWVLAKRQIAIQRVEEMPRIMAIRQSINAGELCVLWQHGVPPQVSEMVNDGYHVVLHQEKCMECASQLVHGAANQQSELAPCGCPQKFVPQQQPMATFSQLDPFQKYMPMVALNSANSIYGVPPLPIQPKVNIQEQEIPGTALTNPNPEGVSHEVMQNFWETWQKVNYPVIFGLFAPRYGSSFAYYNPNRRPVASRENERLRYRFERHQHVVVKVRGAVHPGPLEMRHYILYVHGIYPSEKPEEGEGHLLATMYSFLRATSFCLFQVGLANDPQVGLANDPQVGLRELLLHFRDFDAMGSRQDAIVIPIRDIAYTEGVSPLSLGQFEAVLHTVDLPPDLSRTGYFCRFALRGGGPVDSACVMPVASHLLPHSQRWPEPRYCFNPKPSVIDLSPSCLGLAEGFGQAGTSIDAAFGFDPARDQTWKARYPSAKVYDGTLRQILIDLTTKKLNRPPTGPKGTPRIVLLTIPDKNGQKAWEQTISDFKITHIIPRVLAAFPSKPDFWVFTMPPWVFLERAFDEFFKAMYTLLLDRYAVHLRNVNLKKFGVPAEGCALVLVASCVPSPIPWDDIFTASNISIPNTTTPATGSTSNNNQGIGTGNGNVTVASRIADLNFFNTRPSPQPNLNTIGKTLVCKHPTTNADVYNHETGWMVLSNNAPPANLNLNAPLALERLRAGVRHFQRGDVLTVRELARVQGFPDDFIFLGTYSQQYYDVLDAFPPPIARMVAGCLLLAVGEYSSFGAEDGDDDDGYGNGGITGGSRSVGVVQRGPKRLRAS